MITVVDSCQPPGVDQMISTRLQLINTKKVKLCFVCSGVPFYYLFVGRSVKAEWVASSMAPIAKSASDPPWILDHKAALMEMNGSDAMEDLVIVYEGRGPSVNDIVWTSGVSRVSWIDVSGRGRARVPRDAGWWIYRRSVSHSALGGVTNAMFSCFLVSRFEEDSKWSLVAAGIRTTLRQVVDPTNGGRTVAAPTEFGLTNTADGLLQWNRRFGKMIVPTVYSKVMWAERRLTDIELADVLDLPGTLRKRLKPVQLSKAREMVVPGKVIVALFDSLNELVVGTKGGQDEKEKVEARLGEGMKRKAVGDDLQGVGGSKKRREEEKVLIDKLPFRTVSDKATKSDDAPAPVHLFDNRILDSLNLETEQMWKAIEALEVLRRFALRIWKRRVRKSFSDWSRQLGSVSGQDHRAMMKAGWDACRRVDGASCWDWDAGSALLFWRWPEGYQRDSWEGVPPRVVGDLPLSKCPQPPYEVEEVRQKVSRKLQKVLDRGYIEVVRDAELKSYMFMFDVPKGDSDVRMVYDGSKSGFNDATWAPWFALPTVEAMSRTVLPASWCGDRDFGEMFLNFALHPVARLYCGVDLSQLSLDGIKRVEQGHFVGRWTRNAMGLKSSPYLAVQAVTRVKRKFLGDRFDASNPFNWKQCILNMPGTAGYDPTMPWIRKTRDDGTMATDLHIYVDDGRITGMTQESVWSAGSRVAKLCSFYGLQDAPRKLREPSQEPGAWAGSVVSTSNGVVTKFVTEERWRKTQGCIRWLARKIGLPDDRWSVGVLPTDEDSKECPKGTLPHKQAERIRGFLIYVSRTYRAMVPYLKGLHLTLDFWRPDRDEEGWRAIGVGGPEDSVPRTSGKAPRFVKVAPRLGADLKVLMDLTAFDQAPAIDVRAKCKAAAYLVGDASGSGFGDCLWVDGDEGLDIAFGSWDGNLASQSSNFREGYNLILRLEELLKSGKVARGTELWLFTDNSVSESAFNKGSSKSKLLHELCARVRKAEMAYSLQVQIVWIAGTRMIAQGTDGLSRGDLTSGVMAGDEFLSHIPLDRGAFERSSVLKDWFENALPKQWVWLETGADWYTMPFSDPLGRYVWSPPPCLADVALEQLCEVKLIHPLTSHVFVCPVLFTGRWRKQFLKATDVEFGIPVGSFVWEESCHENLVVGLMCPLLFHSPWSIKRSDRTELDKFRHTMFGMLRDSDPAGRGHMRKFWYAAWSQAGMDLRGSVAW